MAGEGEPQSRVSEPAGGCGKVRRRHRTLSALKYYGGKHYLTSEILKLIPEHNVYVEPYGGGATVLINKEPSPIEVYNDIDEEIVNFFSVLRDHPEKLIYRIALTPYSESEFRQSADPAADPIERARRTFIRLRQSFSGLGLRFSYTRFNTRRGVAQNISGYWSAIDGLLVVAARLALVQFFCRPALEIIKLFDSDETLFYIDPPYPDSAIVSKQPYRHTMTDDEHKELLKLLNKIKGKAIVSGYECDIYNEGLADWHSRGVDVAVAASHSSRKNRRREKLWFNFEAAA